MSRPGVRNLESDRQNDREQSSGKIGNLGTHFSSSGNFMDFSRKHEYGGWVEGPAHAAPPAQRGV